MILRTWLYCIIFGLLFTILIYGIPLQEKTIRNIIITIVYFFIYLFFLKKSTFSPKLLIIILCFATTLIDASTLFTNPSFIPLRFPFATLFPILGSTLAFIYKFCRRRFFFLCVFFSCLLFYSSFAYIIPKICYDIGKQQEKVIQNDFMEGDKFLTATKDTVELKNFAKKCTLLEFYFVGCSACEQKYPFLRKIKDSINSPFFRVIMICDGRYTDFDEFKFHASRNFSNEIIFLYDFDLVIQKNFENPKFSFPYEILYNNKMEISYFKGFSNEASNLYLKNQLKTIKNILNDKL